MKWVIIFLCLSGCAVQTLPDNPFQAEAVKTFSHYNAAHHTNIPVPEVRLGSTPAPFAGTTWCPNHYGTYYACYITLNPNRSADLEQTLIHEEAHAICVLSVSGCKPVDHNTDWQRIASELGLSKNDSYLKN